MRRLAVIGVLFFACAGPAGAALPVHQGHPILPGSPAGSDSLRSLRAYPSTLIELGHVGTGGAEFALQQAGGKQIDPAIALWRVPSAAAARLLPGLRATGLVRSVSPDVALQAAPAAPAPVTPHFAAEWWIPVVGADKWTPPGPGVPLTMIDSGVDASNPEFLNRPDTTYLNPQSFTANDEELHGTATASIAAAQGVALKGIYPKAKLQLWDASPAGTLTVGAEIAGLADAVRHGRSVINLSLGGLDRLPEEEHAILAVFGAGSLVVASAGNDREEGSPLSYPASFAHVLTVGATDETGAVADFSSASPHMDLAAPGEDMEVAVPNIWAPDPSLNDPYDVYDGTSFSAPLVSGAAAAVWTLRPSLTNTQLFEVMRRSAHHVGKRGWNKSTGYGILNVPAAVVRKAPAADPQEPNEDVYLVKPNGLFRAGHAPLTTPGHPARVLRAHVEQDDDTEDVYRAYLPAKGRLVVSVKPDANVNLEVWGRRTTTVFERGAAAKRDLFGSSTRPGARSERVVVDGRGLGQYVYLDVFLPKSVREAGYTISVGTSRR